ncbi:hypothetical protein [Microbacterium deminutum]
MQRELEAIVSDLAPSRTFHSLVPEERQAFLQDEAIKFGLDPREQATPESLLRVCVERGFEAISKVAVQNSQAIEEDRLFLNDALKEVRAMCARSFARDGVNQSDDQLDMHH